MDREERVGVMGILVCTYIQYCTYNTIQLLYLPYIFYIHKYFTGILHTYHTIPYHTFIYIFPTVVGGWWLVAGNMLLARLAMGLMDDGE